MVTLTEEEKTKARHHLGYLNVEAAQTFALGVPAAVQTQFMIEGAFHRLLPHAYVKFQELICRLEAIEAEVFCGLDFATLTSIEQIQIRPDRLAELAKYYKIAQESLANLFGVPPNPFDMREWLRGGMLNVPVYG